MSDVYFAISSRAFSSLAFACRVDRGRCYLLVVKAKKATKEPTSATGFHDAMTDGRH